MLVDGGSSGTTIGGAVGGRRNVISGNAEGVMVTDAATTGTLVAGNLIGTDVKGTSAVPNLGGGIDLAGGTNATIGGTTSLAINVIAGNVGDGIDVAGDVTATLIQGNYIGVDLTGADPLSNSGDGVNVGAAAGITIGGSTQGAGNVISGNTGSGVSINGAAPGAIIQGNLIGPDVSATSGLGNAGFGVFITGTAGVIVGGSGMGDRNIISANAMAGIGLFADTTGTLIQGNLIGTDQSGANPLGNAIGIQIDGGSSDNTIGGSVAAAGNVIAFSTGIGVDVDATAGTGNEIRLNSIFSNKSLGISLGGGNAVVLNDSAGHVGPNDYENFPVVTAVTSAAGTTTVAGTLSSTASTTFTLDFYTIASITTSGYGEGKYVLGSATVTTDGAGNATFSFPFPTPSTGAQFVTATATDSSGNTSEFSQEFGETSRRPPASASPA